MQHLSDTGLELLKRSEGFRAFVYWDIAGFRTIGYGHRLLAGEMFSKGITFALAEQLLGKDVAVAEATLVRMVEVPLSQGQFDALVDFVFNLGAGRLAGSTLLAELNAGNYDAAAHQLLLWDHSGHVEVHALKARREAEFQLFQQQETT